MPALFQPTWLYQPGFATVYKSSHCCKAEVTCWSVKIPLRVFIKIIPTHYHHHIEAWVLHDKCFFFFFFFRASELLAPCHPGNSMFWVYPLPLLPGSVVITRLLELGWHLMWQKKYTRSAVNTNSCVNSSSVQTLRLRESCWIKKEQTQGEVALPTF